MMKVGADSEDARRLRHWPLLAALLRGAGFSLFLQYVAHFQIGAFCVWCFSSAAVMTPLFVTATVGNRPSAARSGRSPP